MFGCFQRIPCPEITELCPYACFDFVVINMEYSLVSEERVADLVRSADAAGIAALVRVPDGRPATIGRVLEAGLAGIQVPRIRSAEEAEDVVRATRYPPAGSRRLSAPKQTAYGTRVSLAEHVKASEALPNLTTNDVRLLLNSARAFLARLGRSA